MKWSFRLPESPMLLYYFAKFTGLVPFIVTNNRFHPATILDKLHIVTLAVCYSVLSLIIPGKLSQIDATRVSSLLVRNWNMIHQFFGFAVVTSTLIIFLIYRKKIVHVMDKLCLINDRLKTLDIVDNDQKFFNNIFISILLANAGLVTAHVAMNCIESNWSIYLSIKFSIDSWFTLNMMFNFAGVLIYIRQRFELLNQNLLRVFNRVCEVGSPDRHSLIFVVSKNFREENAAGDDCLTDFQRIRTIEYLHLELCGLIDQITNVFGIPILFNIIQCLSALIVASFWISLSIHHSDKPKDSFAEMVSFKIHEIICSTLRMILVSATLWIIAHASTTTCKQGNATRTVVSKIWDRSMPMELKKEFLMFSTQLLHKPVSITIFGFYPLDNSFIFEVFSTVVVYFFITVQFAAQIKNSAV